jgi:hypothetical protein
MKQKQTCQPKTLASQCARAICLVLILLFTAGSCEKPLEDDKNSALANSSWATLSYGLGAENKLCCVKTQYHFFDGDSVFNNHTYKKLYCYEDEQHFTRFYEGLVRQDNSKIFFVPKEAFTECPLYDFSITKGTTLEYTYYRYYPEEKTNVFVSNVDYVNINGNNVKRIQLSLPIDPNTIIDTWYENIGSINGFLNPIFQVDGGGRILLCHSRNGTLGYHNPQFPNCYYDNAEEIENLLNTYEPYNETVNINNNNLK